MATTAPIAAAKRVPMDSARKTALVAGIFYLITFISIPTLALYGPVKNHRDWILGSGGHTAVLVGGLLEVIVALAGIGTAVTLYPVIKRQNEGVALGFVTSRVLEAAMIFAGVVSLLSLVTCGRPGRRGRSKCGRARHHRRVTRHGLQLGVPARAEPHAGHQRNTAGLPAIPVPARAPCHSHDRTHRGPTTHHRRPRNAVRRPRPPPPGPRSVHSRWLPGSSRSASGWSSKASSPPPSPPE